MGFFQDDVVGARGERCEGEEVWLESVFGGSEEIPF